MRLALAAVALVVAAGPGWSAPRCMTRILSNTGSQEYPDKEIRKGSMFGPITVVKVNKQSGGMLYCGHGIECYPASVIDVVSPCKFTPEDYGDTRYLEFSAE